LDLQDGKDKEVDLDVCRVMNLEKKEKTATWKGVLVAERKEIHTTQLKRRARGRRKASFETNPREVSIAKKRNIQGCKKTAERKVQDFTRTWGRVKEGKKKRGKHSEGTKNGFTSTNIPIDGEGEQKRVTGRGKELGIKA